MYLTVKQQVKHLSKEEYNSLRELSHIAKNLANQAIYNVRQYFAERKLEMSDEKCNSCQYLYLCPYFARAMDDVVNGDDGY